MRSREAISHTHVSWRAGILSSQPCPAPPRGQARGQVPGTQSLVRLGPALGLSALFCQRQKRPLQPSSLFASCCSLKSALHAHLTHEPRGRKCRILLYDQGPLRMFEEEHSSCSFFDQPLLCSPHRRGPSLCPRAPLHHPWHRQDYKKQGWILPRPPTLGPGPS